MRITQRDALCLMLLWIAYQQSHSFAMYVGWCCASVALLMSSRSNRKADFFAVLAMIAVTIEYTRWLIE